MYLGIVGQVIFKNSAGGEWKFEAPKYPFMSSITVAVEKELITTFQIGFEAPYEEGIALMNESPGPFDVGNMVKARIGYSDMNLFTPWYKGMLQQGGEGLTVEPDGLSGSVTAQVVTDQAFYHDIGGQAPFDPGYKDPKVTLEKVCEQIGMKLVLLSGGTAALTDVLLSWGDGTGHHKPWKPLGKTWMEMLKYICDKAACSWWIGDKDGEDVIYVDSKSAISSGKSSKEVNPNPPRNFVMRGKFDPAANQWPIISFGPDPSLASWVGDTPSPARHGGSTAFYDEFGKLNHIEVPALESVDAVYGKKPAGKPKNKVVDKKQMNKELEKGKTETEYLSQPGAPSGADGAKRDVANRGSMGNPAAMANIETLGIPDLFPFELANVYGCSKRFDGPYNIQGYTHTFSASTFNTTVKVLRHGEMFLSPDTPESTSKGGTVPPAK